MSRKQIILVTLAIIGTIGLLMSQLFEFRDIPDLNWRQTYDYDAKEPFGTWVFASLLEERYKERNIAKHYSDTLISSINSPGNLYVQIGQYPDFNSEEGDALYDFLAQGNDALIIGERLDLSSIIGSDIWDYEVTRDSSITLRYGNDDNEVHTFHYRRRDLVMTSEKTFHSFGAKMFDSIDAMPLGYREDESVVFAKWPVGEGALYVHLVPSVFNNLSALQPSYLEHFNQFFDHFDPHLIILDHPSLQVHKRNDSQSPLQFILSQKSLAWAYYLLIFSAVVFMFFRGKRKQKVIPTIEPNVNTSLEYVRAVSSLYEQQGQHKKLVGHLKNIFIHRIKSKYLLDYQDDKFVDKLSKKSNIKRTEVQAIVDRFENVEKRLSFDADQLMNIFNKLDSFYKQCK